MKQVEQITYIYGKHAVSALLKKRPESVRHVLMSEEFEDAKLKNLIRAAGAKMGSFSSKSLPRGVEKDDSHQGIIAEVSFDGLVKKYDNFIKDYKVTKDSLFVILDEIQDPQNMGAIIRSAAALGADAVLFPEHNQAQVTGSVVKVSAGMAFEIPLVLIGNVNNTIRDLKEKRFWIYGLSEKAKKNIGDEKFDEASVLVFGNEESGIRQKTEEHCDVLLKIQMKEGCESLNVSAAGAIALYAWSCRKRGLK